MISGGEHDDRDVGEIGIPALLRPELPAADHGHRQIEQDERRPMEVPAQEVEGLPAVGRQGDLVSLVAQDLAQGFAQIRVVFYDQNAPCGRSPPALAVNS